MSLSYHPPLWGNFVGYADEDLLAFGLLIHGGLFSLGLYHGVQSIEKYLKALVLHIIDPIGRATPETEKWMKTHDLARLAEFCSKKYHYYSEPCVVENLKRLAELDQANRYPWADQRLGNGCSGEDIIVIKDICRQLRNDLPIIKDNYILGVSVRGYFHGDRSKPHLAGSYNNNEAVKALREIIPSLNDFVRGWDTI